MEKIEGIYNFILKTKFEYLMSDVLKDIKIIEFAILCQDVKYKTNVYNNMMEKYGCDLEKIGYAKAMDIISNTYSVKKLSEESIIRNSLSMLRRWIIRCSGYMCVRKISEENIVEGIDIYMKRFALSSDVSDIYTLQGRLDDIDEDILSCLRGSI